MLTKNKKYVIITIVKKRKEVNKTTIIKNLLDDDFPIGREFYIANSLYPRILVKLPSGKQLVICPEHEEMESFVKFVSSYDYRFYNKDGGIGAMDSSYILRSAAGSGIIHLFSITCLYWDK